MCIKSSGLKLKWNNSFAFHQANKIAPFTVITGGCIAYMFQLASVVLRVAKEKQPSGINLPLLQWVSFRGLLRKT